MIKVDKRHTYGIMIDTETANSIGDPLFYDCGWQIIDSMGRKYGEKSFVNKDIFYQESDLMNSSYYAKKLPKYREDIKSGQRTVATTFEIRKQLHEDVAAYGCKFICAHNARFDYRSLNKTQRWVTKSKYRWFTPFGLEWWDTMKMAEDTICTMPTYLDFCKKNNYLCKNGKPRKTAEILFRFISKDNSFIEQHTGLEDVDIEREILAYCVKRRTKMRKDIFQKGA